MPNPLYRAFATVDEIGREYAIHLSVDNFAGYTEGYAVRSEAARRRLACRRGMKYGPTRAETYDVFPAGRSGAPVVVFIHGGYWHTSSRDEWSFVAEGLVDKGITVIVGDYALCPVVSITEIVRQHRALVAHVFTHSAELGVDRNRIIAVGHSAGGHGVASLLATDWSNYDLPDDVLAAGLAISGLYDLRPLRYSFVAPYLQLTSHEAHALSPQLHIPDRIAPLAVMVGSREPAEFIRQSKDYADACADRGLDVVYEEIPRHHFDIVDELWTPSGRILERIVDLVAL